MEFRSAIEKLRTKIDIDYGSSQFVGYDYREHSDSDSDDEVELPMSGLRRDDESDEQEDEYF